MRVWCTIGGGRRAPTESTREEWRPTGERKRAVEKNNGPKSPQPEGQGMKGTEKVRDRGGQDL